MQVPNADVLACLSTAYQIGIGFGTPLSDSDAGKPYADDFLSFFRTALSSKDSPLKGLEIGAGKGYLSYRLGELGIQMTSLEPGEGFEQDWARWGVNVIKDFFPSPLAPPQFDRIFAYGVLEHISDPIRFLTDVREHLSSDGLAFFSVPDCSEELEMGDPSCLVHEHFSYFEARSLDRIFRALGMSVVIHKSKHGRTLYVAASLKQTEPGVGPEGLPSDKIRAFLPKAHKSQVNKSLKLKALEARGSLGLYVPGRALPYLTSESTARLFDDDPTLHGKYLPPAPTPIENRMELLDSPVDTLVLCSRTFNDKLHNELLRTGYRGDIITIEEL